MRRKGMEDGRGTWNEADPNASRLRGMSSDGARAALIHSGLGFKIHDRTQSGKFPAQDRLHRPSGVTTMPSRLHHLPRQLQLQLLPHRRTLSSSRHLLRWLATPLPHRSLIRLTGPESESFLQGLVTNDVSKAQQPFVAPEDAGIEGKGKALATAFLNAPGRTLFDAFVLPLPALSSSPGGQANGGYWIDHPRFLDPTCLPTTTDPPPTDGKPPDGTKALWLHLRRYILRTKVHLALEPSKPTPSDPAFSIWAVFDPDWASRLRATPGVKNQGSVSVQGQVVDEAKEAVQAVLPDQEQKEAAKEKQQYEDEENKVLGQLLEQAGVKVWRDDRAPGMGFRVLVPSTLPSFRPSALSCVLRHQLTLSSTQLPPALKLLRRRPTPSTPSSLPSRPPLSPPLHSSLPHLPHHPPTLPPSPPTRSPTCPWSSASTTPGRWTSERGVMWGKS